MAETVLKTLLSLRRCNSCTSSPEAQTSSTEQGWRAEQQEKNSRLPSPRHSTFLHHRLSSLSPPFFLYPSLSPQSFPLPSSLAHHGQAQHRGIARREASRLPASPTGQRSPSPDLGVHVPQPIQPTTSFSTDAFGAGPCIFAAQTISHGPHCASVHQSAACSPDRPCPDHASFIPTHLRGHRRASLFDASALTLEASGLLRATTHDGQSRDQNCVRAMRTPPLPSTHIPCAASYPAYSKPHMTSFCSSKA
ncbi:hypothetical protein BCR34DRAFT_634788 [Clohesyomyces aquaticus]|uniref:Uncharacterized protein n=1 Tax=Clohesyomyces aquaticus TaxID=1231657 RepID=A0A1Y1Z0M9_9PLEO|nr:hypothetical protein BCR34DRAFT_634788 [Clohesyomyces aquaticus]